MISLFLLAALSSVKAQSPISQAARVALVTRTPGFVALWDFVRREPIGARRFTAHVPRGAKNSFALDASNYVKTFWGEGRDASYADFPLLGHGPFGQAIRIQKETDPTFRPFLFVPRDRLHDSSIDIKGAGKSITLVVWAIRESGNHALAGIWHEGTDLKQTSTAGIKRVEQGQRQYGLFAGLNKEGAACGHVSENGGKSFGHRYAMHKSNTLDLSVAVPAASPPEVLNGSWETFAMTFDSARDDLSGWLNGKASERWQEDAKSNLPPVYNAWMQAELRRQPGKQPGEDPTYPIDQFYSPPEGTPLSVKVLTDSDNERVELQEFRYTRVRVTLRKEESGRFAVAARDLADVRLNPWWFPHDLYTPTDAESGGPFTIGRVIHSSRTVGFTGWIGGVAVFDRALDAPTMARLASVANNLPKRKPTPSPKSR